MENERGMTPDNGEVHFSYNRNINTKCLCQGDVLLATDELKSIMEEVHPYFAKDSYKYFIVLTQSCDLVKRHGGCKSPYITLAAVKSFDDFFKKSILQGDYAENVDGILLMDNKKYQRAFQLIERVYNNTEPDYFFLFKDDILGFPNSMVAYLKVSIALKADLHYDECLRAKKLELTDEFKAKLGWLVGNIYSRVGTHDWDGIMNDSARKEMIEGVLKERCIITSKKKIKILKSEMEKHSIASENEARLFIESCTIETNYDIFIKTFEDILKTTGKRIPSEEKIKLLNDVKSRSAFKNLINNADD